MTYRPKAPAIIDGNMVAIEQIFAEKGAEGVARIIAKRLRESNPERAILDGVARLLDPQPGDDLELVIKRRGAGNPKTKWDKRADDIKVALAVLDCEERLKANRRKDGKTERGIRKLAIGEIAEQRGIKDSTVRKTMRVLSLIPASK
jgi:hypothetical protein